MNMNTIDLEPKSNLLIYISFMEIIEKLHQEAS